MKIKRSKDLLYIFSSVMVLGLALLSFDTPGFIKTTAGVPTTHPNKTPDSTSAPFSTPDSTFTPTQTTAPTPTPTPTPTPSPAQLNAAIAICPATDETGIQLTAILTDYLTRLYNEDSKAKEINDITCYYKEGLADADYFVYVSYDITYEGSNVPVPTLEEYLVSLSGEAITVTSGSENPDTAEALLLSRASQSVSELYMKELVRRYMNAKLSVDEELLSSMVTDPSYLNLETIRKKTEYIEEYKNNKYLIYKCPEEITEFDYLVFLANDSKIVNISTLAAGIEEFLISMDENNYPHIFYGITSSAADTYRQSIRNSEEYLEFYEVNVSTPFTDAMLSDPDLLEFIERIKNATGSTSN